MHLQHNHNHNAINHHSSLRQRQDAITNAPIFPACFRMRSSVRRALPARTGRLASFQGPSAIRCALAVLFFAVRMSLAFSPDHHGAHVMIRTAPMVPAAQTFTAGPMPSPWGSTSLMHLARAPWHPQGPVDAQAAPSFKPLALVSLLENRSRFL
ncbi:hypothetical protein BCR44DRAFT_1313536 [Catenaria anguillulae PL171]|uniref:Uncharacterized protein n=1 Tax=Catenaria anguillulae PL171 TaxID=765915 RepID=A0A1Y2H706_9FUNG|nr:hypothetical protein BCR44DRAFT_1313536 [Catenaria anguillulae PL171]